ncbi:sigma-54-dependent Fis family transcriptional regulator [Carboxydothermus hydrogenoformans]|uniref:Sigma-54 dependent transcriptional regulator n=1 Tax=Carboxydothermus hydrogenoformans (strain ATCC BAA-161 / DSM 6008 / Z-2901) TaxID=246194 RepID=Q3ABV5_CARHZ|nr:sigma-54 dependent transcriptional regulator [Carboxydothermus hydrogenoformans Z-2901]
MRRLQIVTTDKEKCKACYACVRNCPVKAIKIEEQKAEVLEERCIACGNCVRVCSQGAKKIYSFKEVVLEKIKNGGKVIALLAPSYPVSFYPLKPGEVHGKLKAFGFTRVEEVTAGVEIILPEYGKYLKETQDYVISSACPAIVSLIEKHYPTLVNHLAPIKSPMEALAKYIKMEEPDAFLVFIGPCIAKKNEALNFRENYVDAVLTFKEIKELLKGVNGGDTYEYPRNFTQSFPIPGGLILSLKQRGYEIESQRSISVEGKEQIIETLESLTNNRTSGVLFYDLLFCRGCIDGPEIDSELTYIERRQYLLELSKGNKTILSKKPAGTFRVRYTVKARKLPLPTEEEIREILAYTDKFTPEDELNCGACGYNSCREKAIAVYQGLAEIDMCLPFLLKKTRGEAEFYRNKYEMENRKKYYLDGITGQTEKIIEVKKLIEKAAMSDGNVLIQGESGVGKEIAARTIHYLSERADKPFVAINCAAIPENLLESELFGYEEGAFTGAKRGGKAGKIEQADGGTLFLDEIGDMPLSMQVKLLRFIQNREFERIGSNTPRKVDIRIIAATNQPLAKLVKEGRFRMDLYYRLNVFNINIPPLRERRDDIPLLVNRFMNEFCERRKMAPKIVTSEAMNILMNYSWPGNIRELQNVIERAYYLAEGNLIKPEHLPAQLTSKALSGERITKITTFKEAVAEVEKKLIIEGLKATNYNKLACAKLLGIPRATLYQKIKEYGIEA